MIYPDLTATFGKTPLVELARLAKNLPGRVFAKLEMRNPCGSVKDRVGVALIQDAVERGLLKPGMTIVEATAGIRHRTGFRRGNSRLRAYPDHA